MVIREPNGTYTVKHAGQYVFNGSRVNAHRKAAELTLAKAASAVQRRDASIAKTGLVIDGRVIVEAA